MPAFQDKRGRHDPKTPLIVSWADLVISDEEWRASSEFVHVKIDRLEFVTDLFSRSIDACRRGGLDCRLGQQWMACILEELFAVAGKRVKSAVGHHSQAVDEFCEGVRLNPGRRVSVAEIAARLHFSVDHFIRIFRQARGVTPGEFVVNTRIEAAASLLLFTGRSVSEIADELGYCDSFHFSRQFRQRMGLSPLAYRRLRR
jgi:AraC-like DNA-binding protein